MRSYWEQSQWMHADIAIIGGGIVGISTAIECKTRHPEWRVFVLEQGLLPTGASTRNAGFACVGSLSEIASDIDIMGATAAADLVSARLRGLRILAERCANADVGYIEDGGSEIFFDKHSSLDRMSEINQLLQPIFSCDTFRLRNELISKYGLRNTLHALVHTPFEGTLHSGKLLRQLWLLAQSLGVDIRTGATVRGIDTAERQPHIDVEVSGTQHTLRTERVVLATNARIPELLPASQAPAIKPGRGQVIVTKPIANLALRGSFHADEGFYYFRTIDGRVLLGGGRNLNFEEEETTSFSTTNEIQNALEEMLRTTIVPNHADVEIDLRWAGTMGFTEHKQPYVDFVHPSTVVAFGCNGMGVAMSSVVAERVAELLS